MLSSAVFVPSPVVDHVSDAELLERVSRKASHANSARAAEAEFYARHARYLYCVLVQRVRRPLALSGREVEDLVQETFFRAFARAETYSGGDAWDEASQRRRSRAWLGRIAQRLLADWLADAREVSASPYLDTLAEPEAGRRAKTRRSPRSLGSRKHAARLTHLGERLEALRRQIPMPVFAKIQDQRTLRPLWRSVDSSVS